MPVNQLNKLQIKAEVLTVLSKLQANPDMSDVEKILEVLVFQEDKKSILEVLSRELSKSSGQRGEFICFLLLKLCEPAEIENVLWDILKNHSVDDETKAFVLNLLKDMGQKINYEELGEYLHEPEKVIDADTQKLLQTAIINPEAQIDFLDFLNSLSEPDKELLVDSLGEDYSSDDLANILNPLCLYAPTSKLGKKVIEILGTTKSQLALHTLLETLKFVDEDEEVATLIKKSISTLKIAGIREDNAIEFYKNVLKSTPGYSFISYPDGHGNQAIIFSRKKEDSLIQMVAIVINDIYGIIDCFGFNEISSAEFERIVERFYDGDDYVCITPEVAKNLLLNAEKLSRQNDTKVSYEYICWKTLLADIEAESTPIEIFLKTLTEEKTLSDSDLENICMLDFVQRWFFDPEYSDEFLEFIQDLNQKIAKNEDNIDFESEVKENLDKIFTIEQKNVLDKRILMSAYLMTLSNNENETQLLYSLYLDEKTKTKMAENILRKSIYEYYVALKFKHAEENKTTNIFAMKNKPEKSEINLEQINKTISLIENLWVKG